jgi:hypothetical protein
VIIFIKEPLGVGYFDIDSFFALKNGFVWMPHEFGLI